MILQFNGVDESFFDFTVDSRDFSVKLRLMIPKKIMGLSDLSDLTKSTFMDFPKTFQTLGKIYLQPINKKEVFHLNILAVVVGVLSGYSAIGFRAMIGFFQNWIYYQKLGYNLISPLEVNLGSMMFVILPLGLLISNLITH